MPDSAPKALHRIKLFSGLSPEDLAKIEVVCRYKGFSANEQIFDRHSKARDVFFVIRIGTTRETVARVLNDLARRGIVKRTKDALVVSDMARLHEMVENVRG